jgi:hypothetical protein
MGRVLRVGGTCTHLCHPRKKEEEEEQPHYLDNWAIWQKYLAIVGGDPFKDGTELSGDPALMAALIKEHTS